MAAAGGGGDVCTEDGESTGNCFDTRNWACLPEHVVVQILLYLDLSDRFHASLVCQSWQACFQQPVIWRYFHFRFFPGGGGRKNDSQHYTQCLSQHGQHLRVVRLTLDQGIQENRHHACHVLETLASTEDRQVSSLAITFIGENPLFYAGAEFVAALKVLFGPTPLTIRPPLSQILHVDLSGLTAAYDDSLFIILADNNPDLQSLNILNRMLICKVSPACILNLVQRCRQLRELMLYYCSMSDDILTCFTESDRAPIKHLRIVCRREEKYNRTLSPEIWQTLVSVVPGLRVSLVFDHTCPLNRIADIMQPDIPIRELFLETFTMIFDEVNLAATYYNSTLEKVVLQTRNSPELTAALLNLVRTCGQLKCLYVYCVLKKETVEEILDISPHLRESKNYILKWKAEPEPWLVGDLE